MLLSRLPASSAVNTQNPEMAPWMLPSVQQPWGNSAAQDQLSALAVVPDELAARRVTDCAAVAALLTELEASDDPLERNSVEWVTEGLVTVAAVTPTGAPGSDGRQDWFDPEVPYTAPGDPARTVRAPAGEIGQAKGTTILLFSASKRSRATLAQALVHELQHICDHHPATQVPETVDGALDECPAEAYALYRTEFSAWWLAEQPAGEPSQLSITVQVDGTDTTCTAATAMEDPHQLSVFRRLCGSVPEDGVMKRDGAWVTPYAWVPYYYACDPTFRGFVDAMVRPVTANGLNSVAVEGLHFALLSGDDWTHIVGGLDDADRQWLLDPVASAAFWDDLDLGGVDAETQRRVRLVLDT